MTGVSPVMLDELASGFNILSGMTTDIRFNEMIGLWSYILWIIILFRSTHFFRTWRNENT
ncbi:MAG: AAA family ATPase [Leptospiraceae bacterium]|nr:AAA family ATPase [Leptospiraceae bacterium]MCP5496943.1 AAA family ATPase [Leptospiraceae bacterium]